MTMRALGHKLLLVCGFKKELSSECMQSHRQMNVRENATNEFTAMCGVNTQSMEENTIVGDFAKIYI